VIALGVAEATAAREHLHDVRARLTPRRLLGNSVDAVRLDGLRVPPDPEDARRELCGE
jgi:hypothetical protein